MLKKKYRLGRPAIFKNSHIINSQFFTLRVVKNNLLYNRYGFVVSKKIDKRAVVRNKIKRKILSCLYELNSKAKTGFDFLFIVNKEITDKKTSEIFQEVKNIFIKEKLLQ